MDTTARQAGEAAGQRIAELDDRRRRLLSGEPSSAEDVEAAERSAARSLLRARAAHARSGAAHDRSALAHERAAATKDTLALRSSEPDASRLRAEADAHRLAALHARLAADIDRRQAGDD